MRTALLRFNGAVERDPAIDAWMNEHASELGAIEHQWFDVKANDRVRRRAKDGRHVGLDFYDLLIEAFSGRARRTALPQCALERRLGTLPLDLGGYYCLLRL